MLTAVATAKRRLNKIWDDPRVAMEAIEYAYVNRLHWKLRDMLRPISQRMGKYSLRHHGVLQALEAYNSKRPPSSFDPDYYDLWHLYRDVLSYRHRTCLEYGSGQSTVVIAEALYDNDREGFGRGHLTTLESEEKWADINREAIPRELQSYVTIIHSPRQILSRLEIRFSHAPVAAPSFVYLDGPDHPDHSMASLDLLDLEQNFPKHFRLVVDGRTFNKNELLKRFKKRYRSHRRGIMSNDTIVTLK